MSDVTMLQIIEAIPEMFREKVRQWAVDPANQDCIEGVEEVLDEANAYEEETDALERGVQLTLRWSGVRGDLTGGLWEAMFAAAAKYVGQHEVEWDALCDACGGDPLEAQIYGGDFDDFIAEGIWEAINKRGV